MKKLFLLLLLLVIFLCGSMSAAVAEPEFECETIVFEIADNEGYPRYNAIVAVENTGSVAINLGYTAFSVTDSENNLIATESSSMIYALPSVVYPGEVGYYFGAAIELPMGIDVSEEYKLVYDTEYIRVANTEGICDFEVKNVSFPDNDFVNIIGEVVNGSNTGDVDILCLCYDSEGNIVTIGGTLEELKTTHNTYFTIINYGAFDKDTIADYKVIARTRSYN